MTESIDIEAIKDKFQWRWMQKVQDLALKRRTIMSQQQMADLSGRSLKTIQRFENYKSQDPELMFIYSEAHKLINGCVTA